MIQIQQLKLPLGHHKEKLLEVLVRHLHVKKEDILSVEVVKRSLDARKKPELFYSYVLNVRVKNQGAVLKKKPKNTIPFEPRCYCMPDTLKKAPSPRPVVVGTGPAGLFAGLLLAQAGCCPILLERGDSIEKRQKRVDVFWRDGILDEDSNVQFGEGGAGTFSDGKLNTAVKDYSGRNGFVLRTFVKHGAPEEILYLNKPHIGTDVLRTVVANLRTEIVSLGGDVRFRAKVTDFLIKEGRIIGLEINGTERMDAAKVILATGHSARDTFQVLAQKPLLMEAKPFAVGVRMEHPQSMLDEVQYGRARGRDLPAADYKVARTLENRRGVYSFCMCPGGYVVNASSEKGMLAVNGMSYHSRAGENANSAMVVTVGQKDFGGEGILAGMEFQRRLERAAWLAGEGKIPVQLFQDFCNNQKSTALGDVIPQNKGSWQFGDLRSVFPKELSESLIQGISACEYLIPGFSRGDAILSGVESRTSSPVRIGRNDKFESSVKGLYPCGEGAGYAGGITSAAMDGIKVAERVIEELSSEICMAI